MKQDPRTIIDEKQDSGLHRSESIVQRKPDVKFPTFQWVKDKVDSRDYIYKPSAVKVVNKVDLRPYTNQVEDQGPLGSCTGNAIAEAIEMLYNKNKKKVDLSRLFIYYYTRLIEGTVKYDSGAYIRNGIKSCNHYGAPLESLWPYNISKFRSAPSSVAVKDASKRKITRYERALNFNACIDALTNGYPVVVGFLVYDSFMSSSVARTGIMPYPNTRSEKLLGGHAVLLVGYDNTNQRFIVKNSWGQGWGDRGYFYMPYKVIQNTRMSDDFWVIKGVNIV